MIQINRNRVSRPEFLIKPNQEFHENDYRNQEVRTALKNMQFRKCCYCERNLDELDEIEKEGEHFVPRSSLSHKINSITQWHLVNNWANLMIACRACNGTKLAKPPFDNQGERLIIDPTDLAIDPEDEIKFNLKIDIYSKYDEIKSSELGKSTIEKLGLNKRKAFFCGKFRKIRANINNIFSLLITATENHDEVQINNYSDQIKDITKASTPFAAFNRAAVTERLAKFRNIDLPALEEIHGCDFEPLNIQLYAGHEIE